MAVRDLSESPEHALERLRPIILQKQVPERATIDLDIPQVVRLVLDALPNCVEFFDQMILLNSDFAEEFERTKDYARVLLYLHAKCISPSVNPEEINALHDEAYALRELLDCQADLVIQRGALSRKALVGLCGANGYWDNAEDLEIVATTLYEQYDSIKRKMDRRGFIFPLSKKELVRGINLARQIQRFLSKNEVPEEENREYYELRLKTYLLLKTAWDEIRRSIIYLRWNDGDAADLAPALTSFLRCRFGLPTVYELDRMGGAPPSPCRKPPQKPSAPEPSGSSGSGGFIN